MAKVRIIFKSGQVQDIETDKFELNRTGEEVTHLSWENTKPRIMFISLPEIAAIFDLTE